MHTIATDLDRTLFPNGKQEYDNSMPRFKQIVQEKGLKVIFVTGRNIDQIREGIAEYDPPTPEYAIASVGTRIYRPDGNGGFTEDLAYIDFIRENTPGWDVEEFKKAMGEIAAIRLQEQFNQNPFKLSYYIDDLPRINEIVAEMKQRVGEICQATDITSSVDETLGLGLLDILPARANKMEGIEFVRRQLGLDMDHIIYSGDSGNDLAALTYGYKAILVRNATESVRADVERVGKERDTLDKIYFAQGNDTLNGCYVSGIIEGLEHFGVA